MLRDVRSARSSQALPVVRRVHATGVVDGVRLTDLYHARASLQLKHMLRTLARELGYATWEACKRDADRMPPSALDRFRLDLGVFGDYNKIWFADEISAQQWQAAHGGYVVAYGNQAVVMTG
jgi:hypothetical protein